jgi:hypothetical protein
MNPIDRKRRGWILPTYGPRIEELRMILRFILLTAVGLVLCGCREKTEEEKLSKFKSSLHYKAYRLASESVVGRATSEYNKSANSQLDPAIAHSALSIFWFTQQKGKYCYIEAEFLENPDKEDMQLLKLSLQTLALYDMELKQLSRAHYESLKEKLSIQEGKTPEQVELEHKLLLASLIAASFLHYDPDTAEFAAQTLEATTQVDYLGPLVGAVMEAKKGNPISACQQLRDLAKSERFAEHVRTLMAEAAEVIERSDPADKEQLTRDLIQAVGARLIQQVVDDIFTAEDKKVLLEHIQELPEKITGSQDGKNTS